MLIAQTAPDIPQTRLTNGPLQVTVYLPNAQRGYYRGTRFDWSGVIQSLEYKGHRFYGPWYTKTDPHVRDFIYDGNDITAGPCSAIMGPVEEFSTAHSGLGYKEAKAGGTFIKIGVGVLRKPDDGEYSPYHLYEIVDGGKWTVHTTATSVEFTHALGDPASGYGYTYRKTLRLVPGKPELVIEHSLRNTGQKLIQTSVYDHNFFVPDNQPPGPGTVITVPFKIQTAQPPEKGLAEIRGNQLIYLKPLQGQERVTAAIKGFTGNAKDYDVRVENAKAGIGYRVTGDRPLSSVFLWSIRSVVSMEPYIDMSIAPDSEFTWEYSYKYFTVPAPND
jgi:hypothetical protein